MCGNVKDYIDTFIMNLNQGIDWKYLKSGRMLKKQIRDIIFQIDFHSSKYNNHLQVEIRSECRVWCRRYDKSLTIKSGIADIPFLTDARYWWDITGEDDREKVSQAIIEEIQMKVLPVVEELEKNYNRGLMKLIYNYGFHAYSNSIQMMDEILGREEALRAANEYSSHFTEMEKNILKRFAKGECPLLNERNLRYMVENHFMEI